MDFRQEASDCNICGKEVGVKVGNQPPYNAWRLIENIQVELGRGSEGEPHFYPLFTDDELHKQEDGTYTKVAPGLCIVGLEIDDRLIEEYVEERTWVI